MADLPRNVNVRFKPWIFRVWIDKNQRIGGENNGSKDEIKENGCKKSSFL